MKSQCSHFVLYVRRKKSIYFKYIVHPVAVMERLFWVVGDPFCQLLPFSRGGRFRDVSRAETKTRWLLYLHGQKERSVPLLLRVHRKFSKLLSSDVLEFCFPPIVFPDLNSFSKVSFQRYTCSKDKTHVLMRLLQRALSSLVFHSRHSLPSTSTLHLVTIEDQELSRWRSQQILAPLSPLGTTW